MCEGEYECCVCGVCVRECLWCVCCDRERRESVWCEIVEDRELCVVELRERV